MASNPSSRLRDTLARFFPAEPVMLEHRYHFSRTPPPCLDLTIEHLRYIKYQPLEGIDDYATIQEFTDLADAERHWDTQKMYDSRFLIHPKSCVVHQDKYILIFQTIIREFNLWVKAHALGDATDADMWKIFKDIGKNMKYFSTEDQPHGNLREGIGITTDPKAFFFNLGADTGRQIFGDDVRALHGFLTVTEPSLKDLEIREHVKRWRSFLSTSCLHLTPESDPLLHSDIYPLYDPNHVKLVFYYPTSSDVNEKLRFLENMHKLCTDRDKYRNSLKKNAAFVKSLGVHYLDWPAKLKGRVTLNEVYQYGFQRGNYKKQNANTSIIVACEASIVTFAHNCVKHHCQTAQNYNNANNARMSELISSEILDELYTVFPYLIENIYEAFHLALASGYNHPEFSVAQILTGRL